MPSSESPWPIQLPTGGIRKDIPPTAVGFSGLIAAENWIYRDSRFFVRPGLTDFGDDINERPLGFIQYDHGSEEDRVVMGTDDSWWHYDDGNGVWIDLNPGGVDDNPLTGGPTAHVMLRTFESGGTVKLIGVNGVDAPKIWTGTGDYADLTGSPPATASGIAVAADRILMCEGDSLYYSGNIDETDWAATQIRVAETPGNIVTLLEFGNRQTAIYKESSIYMAFAQVDLTAKFRIEMIRSGISGPVSPNAVFPIGELGIHCYLAESGAVMLFDGNAPVSIGDHVQTHIRATRDYDLRARSHGFYDPLQNDIYVFYASSGADDVNSCVIINYDTKAMHYYTFSNHTISAGFSAAVTDSLLVGELPILDTIAITFGEMDRAQAGIILGDIGGQCYHHIGGTDYDITNLTGASYKWTASGSGTNEWYCELVGGGDPSLLEPDTVSMDGAVLSAGTLGALADHEWGYGDNDSLSYSTIYIRDETGDPDGSSVYIAMNEKHAIPNYFETGLQMLDEPRRFGMLHQSEHLFLTATASQDVDIRFGKSDYGEARELDAAQTLDVGAGGPYETQHRLPGRLYSLRMSSTASVSVEWLGSMAAFSETGLR